MAVSRELKRRIKSVTSSKQITKALELVSSAKMRKASQAAVRDRPYAEALERMISHALAYDETPTEHPLLTDNTSHKILLIVLGADRGQAGAFNANLLKIAAEFTKKRPGTYCVTVGRKAEAGLKRLGVSVLQNYPMPATLAEPDDLHVLSSYAEREFTAGRVREVHILYTRFVSLLSQETTVAKLFPITPPKPAEKQLDLIFEPEAREMLNRLLPYYAHVQLYQAALESAASEHSARRMAMKSATDNAGDMIDRLTLSYNQLRQSAITSEIAEITGGAAALES